ncbi:hypothetical protein [Micromonospora sp. LOL_024]|uniref:hypothetical protein n=1 Tax=Micromonospora sp. LOL_024 TaxID=3345412 RepID=UPI003A867609
MQQRELRLIGRTDSRGSDPAQDIPVLGRDDFPTLTRNPRRTREASLYSPCIAAVEVFGTRDHQRTLFLDPADGDRVFFEALLRQAEAFADFATGGPRTGAGTADAEAALQIAEQSTAQVVPA